MSGIEGLSSELFQPAISFLLAANTAGLVEVLLYGLHVGLFCVCMFILARNRGSQQWFIAISAVIMFVLSTADVAITIRILTHDLGGLFDPDKQPGIMTQAGFKNPIFITNKCVISGIWLADTEASSFIADLILLYRCYMVWGRSKYILVGAAFLVLGDTILGYTTMGVSDSIFSPTVLPLYIWTIFAINVLLAIVTVGRIFWVSKNTAKVLGHTQRRGYRLAMAVIIESSVVYSACLLAFISITFSKPSSFWLVTITICYRIVTIMPTLLIVQVGLGRAVIDTVNKTTAISQFDVEGRATNSNSIALNSIVRSTMSTQNGHGARTMNEDVNHPQFSGEIGGPLTHEDVFTTSPKETSRSLSLENPTTQ